MPDEPTVFQPLSLIAENLAATRGSRPVFAGISFVLMAGEVLAVRGPNGSGKSTLLRLLAGLLTPAEGKVKLTPGNGEGEGVSEHAHYVGHLDALKASLTVRDNLAFWATLWGRGAEGIDDALETVGVGAITWLPAAVLSAGQRRRVALARLLIAPRPVWLLDEPTAALDAAGERLLGAMIAGHRAGGGMAVIATHVDLPVTDPHVLTMGAS